MSSRKRKVTIISIIILGLFITMYINPLNVQAGWFDGLWGETKHVEFLQSHSDWLQFGNFFTVIIHDIGWLLIKGLFFLTTLLEGLIPSSLDLLNFSNNGGMQSIASAVINDLVVALMVLTLVFLGVKTVIAKEPPNFKSVGVNIFISAFLILGLPTLMSTMQDISLEFYDSTQTGENSSEVTSLVWGLIQDNTADIIYVAEQNNFDLIKNGAEGTRKNGLTPDMFKVISLSEIITTDVIEDAQASEDDVINSLKYTLSADGEGNYTTSKIKGNALSVFSDSFDSGYFRYPTKFLIIFIGLIALGFAYMLTIFIFATTAIEIGFKRIIGLFVFATDLESGQKTKMVVQDIMNAFLLIAFTGLSLKMYTLFLSFLATSNLNVIIYVVAIVSATFVLIKGSNTIMRYFGIDVGLKDGFAQIMGAVALGNTAANMLSKNQKPQNKQSKDSLSDKGQDDQKSINGQEDNGNTSGVGTGSKLKNSINSVGKTLGYVSERGLSGMTEDMVKGTGEKIAEKGKGIAEGVKGGFDGVKNSYQEGLDGVKSSYQEGHGEGTAQGQANQEKWKNKKAPSINDLNEDGLNDGEPKISKLNQAKMGVELANLEKQAKKGNMSEEEQDEKFNAITDKYSGNLASNNTESVPNVKSNAEKSINQPGAMNNNASRQDIVQDIKPGVMNNTSRQNVVQDANTGTGSAQPTVQKILQQVEKTSFANPESAKQSIIQEIQKGSFGSNDEKQRIVQQVEKSSVATPEQVQQNVQQVLSSANVPGQMQSSVQKIIQEMQSSTVQDAATIKARIVQEVESASFGGNETLKQNIVQEVQKSFSATPEQMQQNIKQIIETTGNKNISSSIQQEVKTKIVEEKETTQQATDSKSGYFDSLLGQDLKDSSPKNIPKKKSRFDFIKNT